MAHVAVLAQVRSGRALRPLIAAIAAAGIIAAGALYGYWQHAWEGVGLALCGAGLGWSLVRVVRPDRSRP